MGPQPDAPISRVFHVKVLSEDSDRPRPYQARTCPSLPPYPTVHDSCVCGLLTARRVLCSTRTPCADEGMTFWSLMFQALQLESLPMRMGMVVN